ncbi:UNVERIFIED_CONTAM: hypothetical protein FKN15_028954 [Acipenser sinensis]
MKTATNIYIFNLAVADALVTTTMPFQSTDYLLGTTECALQFPEPYVYWDTLMKICVFIFAFVVPVLIISVCYTLMILRLKSVRLLSGSREKDRNLRRITKLVLVVVAIFIICWTPIHIFILVKVLTNIPETTSVMAAYFFCVALGYTNSSLNPILYTFLDENFKRCFKDFCIPSKQKTDRQRASRHIPPVLNNFNKLFQATEMKIGALLLEMDCLLRKFLVNFIQKKHIQEQDLRKINLVDRDLQHDDDTISV